MIKVDNTPEVVDNSMAERRLHAAWVALQDAERAETTTREEADRRRAALARLLAEERKRFPKSGPAAAGWGSLLARIGIAQQRAWELMRLVEIAPPGGEALPSLREAGIKPRERDVSGRRSGKRSEQTDRQDDPGKEGGGYSGSPKAKLAHRHLMAFIKKTAAEVDRWPAWKRGLPPCPTDSCGMAAGHQGECE